jgi:hypothetical protein
VSFVAQNAELDGALMRLQKLSQHVGREIELVQSTAAHLFALSRSQITAGIEAGDSISEQVEAFVSRFGRLQDNIADKLLPALLAYLQEPIRPMGEMLAYAEKLGWIDSVDDWLRTRKLRNQLIHDYDDDAELLVNTIFEAYRYMPVLVRVAGRLQEKIERLK